MRKQLKIGDEVRIKIANKTPHLVGNVYPLVNVVHDDDLEQTVYTIRVRTKEHRWKVGDSDNWNRVFELVKNISDSSECESADELVDYLLKVAKEKHED